MCTAWLLLAHGRLLRRTGQRRIAIEHLRRAHDLYLALRAALSLARTAQELAACDLPAGRPREQSVLALTSRETEMAHLVGMGRSNSEIASELFISRKAVEYQQHRQMRPEGTPAATALRRAVPPARHDLTGCARTT